MTVKRSRRVIRVASSEPVERSRRSTQTDGESASMPRLTKKPRSTPVTESESRIGRASSEIPKQNSDDGGPVATHRDSMDNDNAPSAHVAELQARIVAQEARIDELLAIRHTDAERALEQYKQAVEEELSARATACDLYRTETERLQNELRELTENAKMNLLEERARCEMLQKRNAKLQAKVDSNRRNLSANVPAARPTASSRPDADASDREQPLNSDSRDSSGPEVYALAFLQQLTGVTSLVRVSRSSSKVNPYQEKNDKSDAECSKSASKSARGGCTEDVAKASSVPEGSANASQGIENVLGQMHSKPINNMNETDAEYLVTIANPLDGRRIEFRLWPETESKFCYHPVQINLPHAPGSAFSRDELTFDKRGAPVLFRQLLAFVYETAERTSDVVLPGN